jgi:hypothetical protein
VEQPSATSTEATSAVIETPTSASSATPSTAGVTASNTTVVSDDIAASSDVLVTPVLNASTAMSVGAVVIAEKREKKKVRLLLCRILHQSFVFYSVSFGSNNVERSMISNIES